MIDRETVITGLECCCNHIIGKDCSVCPYEGGLVDVRECTDELTYQALQLLKEQQETIARYDHFFGRTCIDPPVEEQACPPPPRELEPVQAKIHAGTGAQWYISGCCDYPISPGANYCPKCGRRQKWE